MRFGDRMVLQLTPEAVESRQAALQGGEVQEIQSGKAHMTWLGQKKDAGQNKGGIVTVLDVGSSKVCCVVAQVKPM